MIDYEKLKIFIDDEIERILPLAYYGEFDRLKSDLHVHDAQFQFGKIQGYLSCLHTIKHKINGTF
jgi:hypothetical protein